MQRLLLTAFAALLVGGLCYGGKSESTTEPAKVTIHFRWYEQQPGGAQRDIYSPIVLVEVGKRFDVGSGGLTRSRPETTENSIPEFDVDLKWGQFLSGRCGEMRMGKFPLEVETIDSTFNGADVKSDAQVVIGRTLHIRANVQNAKKTKIHCGGLMRCEILIEEATKSP